MGGEGTVGRWALDVGRLDVDEWLMRPLFRHLPLPSVDGRRKREPGTDICSLFRHFLSHAHTGGNLCECSCASRCRTTSSMPLVKDGTAGAKVQKILADLKPEAAYFMTSHGHRAGVLIVHIDDPSQIPALAEPWFLMFEADVEIHPVMVPEDLGMADLAGLGKKWG